MNYVKEDKALQKAKFTMVVQRSVFLATIAFNLKYKWEETIPTAGVDGITVFINPDFFLNQCNEAQRIFVIAHEAWHVALNHIVRRNERDPELYNEAGDYVINQLLHEAGYEMFDWVLRDQKYAGMSTHQVYELLKKEEDKKDKKPAGGNGPASSSTGNKMAGDVMPCPVPDKEMDNITKTILTKAVAQSKMQSEKPGSIPGEITRELDKLLNPIMPWESILDMFLTDLAKNDYTWRRPNRRFMPEFYLPTQQSNTLGHITIAIDTSGSITKEQLREILSEISYIHEKFRPQRLTILDCDRHIHNVHEVTPDIDIRDLRFTGGGGTAFQPVIDYCEKNETQALLYFTDLYGRELPREPAFPLIWLCYSNHAPATTGETIYYKN